jgi:hypothetical protein
MALPPAHEVAHHRKALFYPAAPFKMLFSMRERERRRGSVCDDNRPISLYMLCGCIVAQYFRLISSHNQSAISSCAQFFSQNKSVGFY